MKKFLLSFLVVCLCLIGFTQVKTDAASFSIGNSGSNTVSEGQQITITFTVNSPECSSGSIAITTSNSLKVISCKWLVGNTLMASVDEKNQGAFALNKAGKLSGNYFQVVVQGTSIDANAWVKGTVNIKNGSNDLGTVVSTKSIKVICKNHKFGEYREIAPTCTNKGKKERTCSVCGTVDTLWIDALGHDLSNLTITKEATCTETGLATGICARCNQNVTVTTPAKGHDWGSWKVITPATCTSNGLETRTCKACNHKEEKITDFAPHTLDENDMVVEKEPTISSCGIASGTCKVCQQTVRSEIPCNFTHQDSHLVFTCDEGVFEQSTEIVVQLVQNETEENKAVASLNNSIDFYTLYDIKALLNGAEVQPNGTVTVTIPIPEDYSDNVGLVYVDSDGHIETITSVKEGNSLKCQLTHFSYYAVIDFEPRAQEPNLWFYTTIGCGICTVVLCVLLISKKNKKQK